MALSFRPVRPEDKKQLLQIIVEGFEKVTFQTFIDEHFGPLNGVSWRDRWRNRFQKALTTEIVIVGESSEEIVSVVAGKMDPQTQLAFIDILAVARKHHRKGYGRETLRWMLNYFKSLGAVHAHLDCSVTNTNANTLYKSEGFKDVGHSINWYIKIP